MYYPTTAAVHDAPVRGAAQDTVSTDRGLQRSAIG